MVFWKLAQNLKREAYATIDEHFRAAAMKAALVIHEEHGIAVAFDGAEAERVLKVLASVSEQFWQCIGCGEAVQPDPNNIGNLVHIIPDEPPPAPGDFQKLHTYDAADYRTRIEAIGKMKEFLSVKRRTDRPSPGQ